MNYKTIDLDTYPRRAHFSYFCGMANPYAGLTVSTDISGFTEVCKARNVPFFLSFLYCVGQAANSVPQLRQRILNGNLIEFQQCETSHTVLRENGTYGYCRLNTMQSFDAYLREAIPLQQKAKEGDDLDEGEDGISLFYISSVPWLHYTDLHQPTPIPADSNPRITWGKYVCEGGKTSIPVSILAHHGLVDGIHIAAFYSALEEQISRFIQECR